MAPVHHWEPESLFVTMVLTAYLDESGTHGNSVATVMGGAMASVLKWELFEKKFNGLRRKHGFKVFRTKTFRDRDGDFKGWSRDQQIALVDDLERVSDGSHLTGVTMSLNNAEYERDYKRTDDVPPRLRLASKYGLCFETCLLYLIKEADKYKSKGRLSKLYVICELGAANAGDADRIFSEHKRSLQNAGIDILGALSFDSKASSPALMLADFFAHTRWLREFKGVPFSADDLVLPGATRQTTVTALNFIEGGLALQKQRLIEQFKNRVKARA
jgi:hypothetical protein